MTRLTERGDSTQQAFAATLARTEATSRRIAGHVTNICDGVNARGGEIGNATTAALAFLKDTDAEVQRYIANTVERRPFEVVMPARQLAIPPVRSSRGS